MGRSVLSIAGTVGGAIVGSIVPGVGTALGAALGGAITGAIVGAPKPPDQHFEGPRMSDLKVQSSAYGTAIPLIYGRKNRVSGNIIWSSGLIEEVTTRTQKSGGKGGGKKQKTTQTEYSYSAHVAISLGAGECTNIRRIWLNNKLFLEDQSHENDGQNWTINPEGLGVDSISFYTGSMSQPADPTIQSWEGTPDVPRYKGTCYLVFKGLQLADYGNSLPNIEVELDGLSARNAWDILDDICARSGLDKAEYSLHPLLATMPVQGYVIGSSSSAAAAINPLSQAWFFDMAERHGAVRFQPRGKSPRAALSLGDMAARQAGEAPKPSLTVTREQDVFLPREASVTYKDPDLDYQPNTQRAVRSYGDAFQKLQTEIAMSMDAGFARKLADRLLWESWAARSSAEFSTSARFDFLYPTDTVSLPVAGRMSQFVITNSDRGNDGRINFKALSNDPYVYDGSIIGADGVLPPNQTRPVGDTDVYAFNAPILTPSDSATEFNYAMIATANGWRGGTVYRSLDDLITYSSVSEHGVANITGTVETALGVADWAVMDNINAVIVALDNPQHSLESVDLQKLLNGANACWIGASDGSHGEILQFQDALPVSNGVFELRGLLRGRRATEHEISKHSANEIFVLIETDFLYSLDYGLSDVGVDRWYKGVSVYQFAEDVQDSQEFVNSGEKSMTRSPVLHICGGR